jgi:hypothetical protein
MSERQFQDMILELCKWLGLLVYHVNRSDKGVVSSKGFPDLVIVGPMGTVFAELKSQTGTVSTEQKEWLALLARSNDHVYVWRPEDWDYVQQVLKQVAGR